MKTPDPRSTLRSLPPRSRIRPLRAMTILVLLALIAPIVPSMPSAVAQDVALLSPPPPSSTAVRSPAAGPNPAVTLARLEARRPAGVPPVSGPLILLAQQSELARSRPEVEHELRLRHQRRVAARYSVMSLMTIPVPESLHEVTLAERAVTPVLPGARDVSADPAGEPDAYAGFYHEDLVAQVDRPLSLRERGLRRLARRIAFRNARKYMRSQIKDEFETDPSYHFSDYQADRDAIWMIGREDSREDSEVFEEFRRGVLADDPDAVEAEINLVEWGPLQIDDQGGLSVNMRRLFRKSQAPPSVELSAAKEEEATEGESLFTGRSYALDTDLRFTPHVSELAGGGIREFFGNIKASVECDFRDPILLDTYLSTELEAQFKTNGDVAIFLNFVLK